MVVCGRWNDNNKYNNFNFMAKDTNPYGAHREPISPGSGTVNGSGIGNGMGGFSDLNMSPEGYLPVSNGDGGNYYIRRNNPYLSFLNNAPNETDYKRMLTQAIQWEIDNANTLWKYDTDRQLRSEQWAHDSTSAQIARDRAAGLNPDLVGAASSSGSAGAGMAMQAPMQQSSELTDLSNPVETAGVVADVGNMVANVASSFTGGFSAVTGTIQSIMDFGNQFSMNSSRADILAMSRDRMANNFDAEMALDTLSQAMKFADMFPYKTAEDGTAVIPNIEEVSSFLSGIGITDPKYAPIVSNVMATPGMRQKVDELVEAQAKQRAQNINRGFEFYNSIEKTQTRSKLLKSNIDFYTNQIQSNLMSVLSGDNSYVQNLISSAKDDALASSLQSANSVESAKTQSDQIKFIRDMLQYDMDAFEASVELVRQAELGIDQNIMDLESSSNFNSTYGQRLYAELKLQKQMMRSLGTQSISSAVGLYGEANRRTLGYMVFSGDTIMSQNGEAKDKFTKRVGIVNYTYDHYFENPTSFSQWFTPVVNGVVDVTTSLIGLGRGGSSPQLRMKTTSHFGNSSSTVYDYGQD